MKISISNNANPNYLAKVVRLKHLRKHSNADKLQCVMIDGNNVIVGLDQHDGDIGVFFPLESQLAPSFLKKNSLYRDKENNANQDKAGFFELNGRVRAVKLRGEKSEGFWTPANYFGVSDQELAVHEGVEFDTLDGELLVNKYVLQLPKTKEKKDPKLKKDQVRKKDLLVEGQFNFHIDTPQLGKNMWKIQPEDRIVITHKLHGTSFICSNVLVKRKLTWWDKVVKFLGAKVVETEYKNLYSSRRVIKNLGEQGNGYYGDEDVWGMVNEIVGPCLTQGMTVYGEAVGYLPSNKMIQKDYDYGCEPGKFKTFIYRITSTGADGKVIDWSHDMINAWCQKVGLQMVPTLWRGKASDILADTGEHWHENVLQKLKDTYLEKMCWLCVNKVPDEGIVVRREEALDFDVYKLKSFAFLKKESDDLDKGEADMESQESMEQSE